MSQYDPKEIELDRYELTAPGSGAMVGLLRNWLVTGYDALMKFLRAPDRVRMKGRRTAEELAVFFGGWLESLASKPMLEAEKSKAETRRILADIERSDKISEKLLADTELTMAQKKLTEAQTIKCEAETEQIFHEVYGREVGGMIFELRNQGIPAGVTMVDGKPVFTLGFLPEDIGSPISSEHPAEQIEPLS